jgi:ribosomal protein L23
MEMYKVQPTKIAMTKIPGKSVFVRGKKGERSSGKKAYVYVKKGDKIEIV